MTQRSKIVIIDPGHGGMVDLEKKRWSPTPGKMDPDGFFIEGHYNRILTKKITHLEEKGIKYVTLVDGLADTSLKKRFNTIKKMKKNVKDYDIIYIAIHSNASGSEWDESARGCITFYPARHPESFKLAKIMQSSIIANFQKSKYCHLESRGIKTGNFYMLRKCRSLDIPAILIEREFHTSRGGVILMLSCNYYHTGIHDGVKKYFEQ